MFQVCHVGVLPSTALHSPCEFIKDTRDCMHACLLSHLSLVWLYVTLWTLAHKAPLSMEFSRQECWSGFPCPPPGDLSWPSNWTWVFHISPISTWVLHHCANWYFTSANWEDQKTLKPGKIKRPSNITNSSFLIYKSGRTWLPSLPVKVFVKTKWNFIYENPMGNHC